MPFLGHQLQPRELAEVCHQYWRNYELTKAVATGLGESQGFLGAYHDNLAADVASRDCGLFEINIPASQIGTPTEFSLRTEDKDPAVWEPVMQTNVSSAKDHYDAPWTRNGQHDIRRWQAWVAYTSGWATFPEFWVWAQDANGVPIGEWRKTGRYVQKAICGQMNYHVVILKDWTTEQALFYGARYAEHFGVQAALAKVKDRDIIGFIPPAMPSSPPADGIGPRPVPNDGT